MPRFLGIGNGSDGVLALGSFTQVNVSCSGTSGSTSLTATGSFSPGDRLFIHQSRGTNAGKYEDNTVASYTSGTITLVHPLENTYTDSGASQAQVVVVPEASSVTGSYTQPAWDGDKGGLTVIACSGTFAGTITASAKGYRYGLGGQSNGQTGYTGEGTSGAGGAQSRTQNGSGGGAGLSSAGGGAGGAGGGNAAAGTDGEADVNPGGIGGDAVGQADLTTGIFMGGGGGGGASDSAHNPGGSGGSGGGIIVVYANNFDSNASLITNGQAGNVVQNVSESSGGGGGGAGGTILVKGKIVSIGSSKLTASAGSGGAGGGPTRSGGSGSVGRIRIESCSLSGTTSPSASTSTGGHGYCGSVTFIF